VGGKVTAEWALSSAEKVIPKENNKCLIKRLDGERREIKRGKRRAGTRLKLPGWSDLHDRPMGGRRSEDFLNYSLLSGGKKKKNRTEEGGKRRKGAFIVRAHHLEAEEIFRN